jgi:iron complex outermembrane receptor protein
MPYPRRPSWRRRAVLAIACWVLFAPFAALAEQPLLDFDLPAGNASLTLRQFSRQAGIPIFYLVDAVRGERTPAVHGRFAPERALEAMLAGTALVAVRDPSTKAFAIARKPSSVTPADGRAEGVAPVSPGSGSPTPQPTMKEHPDQPRRNHRPRLFSTIAAWLGLSLASVSGADVAADAPTGAVEGRVQNAVSGRYLEGARVLVDGTTIEAFTDQSGSYRLVRVPSGPQVLQVFYTGLDPERVTVTVPANGRVEQGITLSNAGLYGERDGVLQLDPFTVQTARESDTRTIAINEQRFSPNIKNVISTDALGDVMDGQVGEFLKFLPGITPVYDAEAGGAVASVSVRGLPTSMTVVSSDGMEMASTGNPTSTSRVFQFKEVSINNISRLEVTKVPTPASPADSMAGSIDMISKSAFEREKAEVRYSVSLSGVNHRLSASRQPHMSDEKIYKIRPSVTFDYTLPVTPNFGIVVTGQYQDRFIEQHRASITYQLSGTGTGASPEKPYLRQYEYRSEPRVNTKQSLALRADWRPHPGGVISLNVERGRYVSDRFNSSAVFNAGNNGTPSVSGGTALTYGPDFVEGATGRGGVTLMNSGSSVVQQLDAEAVNLRYRFDDGTWRIFAGFGASESKGGYEDMEEGRFRTLNITMNQPVRVAFSGITDHSIGSVRVFANNGQEIDWRNLANYRLNSAFSSPRPVADSVRNAKVDVRRTLDFVDFPAAIQVGALLREKDRNASVGGRRQNRTYDYLGPDGNAGTPDSPVPFAMTNFVGRPEVWGWGSMPWASVIKAWDSYVATPALWALPASRQVAAEQSRIQESRRIKEEVHAYYAQLELNLLRNRLRVLGGVRFEDTSADGQGALIDMNAVWVRNADGSFARTSSGARIRKPEAGANNSMEQLRLTHIENGFRTEQSYDGYYPSLHLTYSLRENLLLRLAYARTYGRADFDNLFPRTTLNEFDTPGADQIPGTIVLSNTGLRPWTADNLDLSLEHYTTSGGLFSVGVFHKDISDFFGNDVRLATPQLLAELGLDPGYVGWNLSTAFNLASQTKVTGVEFNISHNLRRLGAWGRHFDVFVNGTKLRLEGDYQADFSDFVAETANWGVTFARRPFVLMAKWNYRGKQRLGEEPSFGAGGYEYIESRLTLDVNVDWQIRPNLSLYLNGQNITNEPEYRTISSSLTPAYARPSRWTEHGVQLTLGVKGTF